VLFSNGKETKKDFTVKEQFFCLPFLLRKGRKERSDPMQTSDRDATIRQIRRDVFLSAWSAGAGHLASAYSVVEILYALYFMDVLRYRPQEPDWPERDRFVLSKGHASLAYYSVLSLAGYFGRELLYTFAQPGSRLGGEPNMLELPGVEATTGSLGHGLSYAAGTALSQRLDDDGAKTFVLLGDGECEEGSTWEAAMIAAKLGLNNLTAILDCNCLQKLGTVANIAGIDDWPARWNAFGWDVFEADGHDPDAVADALKAKPNEAPRILIAHTVKGKGVSIMENRVDWHYRLPNPKQLKKFMEQLDISEEELRACRQHS